MTDQSEQDKSELPTSFKLQQSRRKGSVARGADLGFLSALAAFVCWFWFSGQSLGLQIAAVSRRALLGAPQVLGEPDQMIHVTGSVLLAVIRPLSFAGLCIFLVVLVFELIQTGPVFSTEALKPDFNRLNPVNGLKRLFSVRLLIETAKNTLKMAVYVGIAGLLISQVAGRVTPTITDAKHLAGSLWSTTFQLLFAAIAAAAFFAVFDQFVARRDFLKKMRMSRREVRRENKDREGDPRVKQKRKQLHAEFAKASQSLRGVRGADVLVTNPTHYAVALRYDSRSMVSPMVVSQGVDRLAARLRRLAFIYGVVIVNNPPLARALYKLPLNAQVPEDYFKPIADIYLTLRRNRAENDK